MRVLRKVLAVLAIILAAGAVTIIIVERGRGTSVMGEEISADESAYTASIVASAIDSVNYPEGEHPPYRRDVHAKAHGCVRATVEVDPQVPAAYRAGVFSQPGRQYPSWIRFSNGSPGNPLGDGERDARGMALKLTGVAGTKLLEGEQDAETQDFIMVNSPVFFIRNVADYAKFARVLADDGGMAMGYFLGGANPLGWHLRDAYLALGTKKKAPASLLHEQYHSWSAYKLGDLNIKFSARACTKQPVATVDRRQPDFLRAGLKAELNSGEGCFDLLVQPQVAGKNMPVEDTTVRWKESDSAFVKVATVHVPKQEFDTERQNEFCESLSFTPWHTLPEHRPLGGINRIRRAVYQEVARYRRAKMIDNSGKPYLAKTEPKGWCLDLSGATCEATKP